jgi:hypothetical protein
MTKHPNGALCQTGLVEASSAYWEAVSTLMEAKIPPSDEMIQGSLEYLKELGREGETDAHQAA